MSNLSLTMAQKQPFSCKIKAISAATLLCACLCHATTGNAAGKDVLEETVTVSNSQPVDLGQGQAVLGYRQQGYVNQDSYDTNNIYGVENLGYYGDWDSNEVYIIDVDEMSVVTVVTETGDGPYGIDQQGPEKAYALTRLTESLTVVDNYTLENIGIIPLQHRPRSTNFNANTALSIVSGGDKAMTSIIRTDHDHVTKVVGDNVLTTPEDFGGSLSTGHPLWVTDSQFFMLDRAAREIQLWDGNGKGKLLSTLAVPTSVHHVFQPPQATMAEGEETIFYAVIEGNQSQNVSPGVFRFQILNNKLVKTGQIDLYSYDPDNLDLATMGSHHADFHPNGKYIYIGSAEGHVFVINKDTWKIKTMIEAGAGAGHTTFLPMIDRAIVTNHNSTFMTVINTTNHHFIKNIEVASSADPSYKSQAHTSAVNIAMTYFYSAASHDGTFFRIPLDTLDDLEIVAVPEADKLRIKREDQSTPNLLMGSFSWAADAM